jgi:hypothetical protein
VDINSLVALKETVINFTFLWYLLEEKNKSKSFACFYENTLIFKIVQNAALEFLFCLPFSRPYLVGSRKNPPRCDVVNVTGGFRTIFKFTDSF